MSRGKKADIRDIPTFERQDCRHATIYPLHYSLPPPRQKVRKQKVLVANPCRGKVAGLCLTTVTTSWRQKPERSFDSSTVAKLLKLHKKYAYVKIFFAGPLWSKSALRWSSRARVRRFNVPGTHVLTAIDAPFTAHTRISRCTPPCTCTRCRSMNNSTIRSLVWLFVCLIVD